MNPLLGIYSSPSKVPLVILGPKMSRRWIILNADSVISKSLPLCDSAPPAAFLLVDAQFINLGDTLELEEEKHS